MKSLTMDPRFSALSLIIGTRSASFLARESGVGSSDEKAVSLRDEIAIWPAIVAMPGIRHLRLEAVLLDNIYPENFDLPAFKDLRVLMLYPWPYTASPEDVHRRLPTDGSCEAQRLQALLAAAPATLRIIFIGAYRIWLRRGSIDPSVQDAEAPLPVPMPLSEAKADEGEMEAMRKELSYDDWDFVKSVPKRPAQDLSLAGRVRHWGEWVFLADNTIRKRSYLVVKRVEDGVP